MKGSKHLVSIAALGVGFISFASSGVASIINSDAGLAGKRFCWSEGADQEHYGADHTYVHYSRPTSGQWDKQQSEKGTWSISKDGTVTLKLDTGTQSRRYDLSGSQVKELTGSLPNFGGAPGKRC